MPFGYSYLDFFKAKKKGEFLRKNLNEIENKIYFSMFIAFRIFMLGGVIILPLFILFPNSATSSLFIQVYLLFAFSAIVLQGFRKVMFLKYGYYSNQKWYKIIFFIIMSFLWIPLAIWGFDKLISFMIQFQV